MATSSSSSDSEVDESLDSSCAPVEAFLFAALSFFPFEDFLRDEDELELLELEEEPESDSELELELELEDEDEEDEVDEEEEDEEDGDLFLLRCFRSSSRVLTCCSSFLTVFSNSGILEEKCAHSETMVSSPTDGSFSPGLILMFLYAFAAFFTDFAAFT